MYTKKFLFFKSKKHRKLENTEKIVKSSNAAMRLLHAASKFINDRKILKEIYYVYIRSRLEHSAVVWNSSLTQKNINDLERVQKAAVRVIYGNNYYVSYLQALQELGMDSLADRREKMCLGVRVFKHPYLFYKY